MQPPSLNDGLPGCEQHKCPYHRRVTKLIAVVPGVDPKQGGRSDNSEGAISASTASPYAGPALPRQLAAGVKCPVFSACL